MLSPIDLTIQRSATEAFIKADSTSVVLNTVVNAMVAGTKRSGSGPDRDSQNFKVIWTNEDPRVRDIADGQPGVRRFDFVIVGSYDAEMAVGDFWKVGEQKFVIEYIFPDNGYERKAGGVSHGPSANL